MHLCVVCKAPLKPYRFGDKFVVARCENKKCRAKDVDVYFSLHDQLNARHDPRETSGL